MGNWVSVPDNWTDSDQTEQLGADTAMLHLSALCYCARHLTDGDLPQRALRRLWPVDDVTTAVKALEECGEWERTDEGWLLVNWRTFLLSAEEIESRRRASRESSERYRRHKAGDHSMCDRCAVVKAGDKSRDKSRDPSGDSTRLASTRLDSTRRGEERRESEREPGANARSAGATRARAGSRRANEPHPSWAAGHGLPPGVTPAVTVTDENGKTKTWAPGGDA